SKHLPKNARTHTHTHTHTHTLLCVRERVCLCVCVCVRAFLGRCLVVNPPVADLHLIVAYSSHSTMWSSSSDQLAGSCHVVNELLICANSPAALLLNTHTYPSAQICPPSLNTHLPQCPNLPRHSTSGE